VEEPEGPIAYSNDTPWRDLHDRIQVISRKTALELAVRLSYRVLGNIVEFGVAEGDSTRILRRALTRCERGQLRGAHKSIFGFDSFEGLPEQFENASPGAFACDPPEIRGVEIVKGYYEQSLTDQVARRVGPVALASLDADLYSSTLTALRWLTPLLNTGSLLLFDEYIGEHASERRAHMDWGRETGIQTVMLAEFFR
jgi:hypothetical protein